MSDTKSNFHSLDYPTFTEAEQLERSLAFLQHMKQRRTVRDFSSRPVPYELIENAIATAATAPNGANLQPWSFVVVSDPETKRQIRMAAEAEEKKMYAERISDEMRADLSKLGTNWEKAHLEDAPYLIVVFALPFGLLADGTKKKHYYTTESVGIAVGMLIAALHHVGLATLTHTPSPMGFLADILQRPKNERAYVVMPVGYPADDAQVPAITKKPLDEILTHIDQPLSTKDEE